MRGETPGDLPQLFIPAKEARKHKNIPVLRKRIGKNGEKNSHLYKDVHDETQCIVICTEICMTKIKNNMEIHSYKNVNDENLK